ncbi:class I SAM-dependent methyltransferase [Sphingomonas koreensis]|jgi:ubiquinone/menaquinone biosynthesis C-methylase UbiE|uniref:SAM-dependent methyltransferase n=1 Tax=Sphingomonas koreensis TaxID=93064 RepID=A0A1L6JA15_9SPHN|nr:class I SAM-dependent methyltransferase [Sphingomonas koreensis]APR52768.1 SAM-dependent methyltransferase [Sphingomonas koreensis]MDC7811094.1 class I SAM-dependent methyltransferase [Sphingomonas koreensis]RSU19275.1 class I SAM-dependent methyltransferase [Sphingomonas koreensis]RSU28403.1 class I SAM-dependent methyltransferase [Sphingomonas koreensis]RSU31277.1 class I SAM-dependent methyltransferase [Sphingomonas koreensis]
MTASIDEAKLHAFIGKMLGDLGGAMSVPTVRIGLRLGLFEALTQGPATAAELAARAGGLHERYVREWALAQAANGYIGFDPATQRFDISPEQAMVFVNPDSPVYLAGAFELIAAMIEAEPKVEACFRHGTGVRWGDHAGCLFCATGAFFRPGYVNNIVQAWIPALNGVEAKLRSGAKVADVGCGVGFSTLLMAEAYPESEFTGYDFHAPSIEEARRHAQAHGLSDRVRFEVATAKDIPDSGFDLVTMYDCLHDMGDPRGCAAHMHGILAPGGTWMIVEPIAGDSPEQNFNPVGRLYYNASTMICVPTSLDQEVGEGLGAQAGEARLAQIVRDAGFEEVRRATEGPFNMVLEAA